MYSLTPITGDQSDSPEVQRYQQRISDLCAELDQLVMSSTRSSGDVARQQSIQTQISSVELLLAQRLKTAAPPHLEDPMTPLVSAQQKERVVEFAKHLSEKRPFKSGAAIPNPEAYLKYFDLHAIHFQVISDLGKLSALQLANLDEKQVEAFLRKHQESHTTWNNLKKAFIERFEPFDFKVRASQALRAFRRGKFERFSDFATRFEAFVIDHRLNGNEFLADFQSQFTHSIIVDAFATAKVTSVAQAIEIVISKDHLSPSQSNKLLQTTNGFKSALNRKQKGAKRSGFKYEKANGAANEHKIVVGALSPDFNKSAVPRYLYSASTCSIHIILDKQPATVLVDSGSGANVVSNAFVTKHKLRSSSLKKRIELKTADGKTLTVTKHCLLTVEANDYKQKIDFLVADIMQDAILGLPFFHENMVELRFPETIVIKPKKTNEQHKLPLALTSCHTSTSISAVMVPEDCWSDFTDTADAAFVCTLNYMDAKKHSEESETVWHEFADLFEEPKKPPSTAKGMHLINFVPGAAIPKRQPLRRISNEDLDELKTTISELLDKGFIRASNAPTASQILFVKKKDGTKRLCVDYRRINDITIKDATVPPRIEELRDRLQGAKIFSKVDQQNGYYNIAMNPADIWKTAFQCRYGVYEFTVMPFGLCNAPSTFTRIMQQVLAPLIDQCVVAFLDDVIIYSNSAEEHKQHVRQVLQLLREHSFKLKRSKCFFFVPEVEFCGFLISSDGIKTNPEYIKSIQQLSVPSSVKELQAFLGALNWVRDFVPEFASLAYPLYKLTAKNVPYKWTDEHQQGFDRLKKALVTPPVLAFFDPSRETTVYTDASNFAIGGWLSQLHEDKEKPVLYWSRKLSKAELNYPTHELELLALVEFLKRVRHYLLGTRFVAKTDHQALIWLNSQPFLSKRQAGWISFLQEFSFEIKYLPGPKNTLADLLSRDAAYAPRCHRCNDKMNVNINTISAKVPFDELSKAHYDDDDFCLAVRQIIADPSQTPSSKKAFMKRCSMRNDSLYYDNRLIVPQALQQQVLQMYHDSPSAQHRGLHNTLNNIQAKFYWRTLVEDVKSYVLTCDSCQRNNYRNKPPAGKLHPLPIPSAPLQDVEMDFAELPIAKTGEDFLVVIVDRLTKMTVLIPCLKTITSDELAALFIQHWFKRFGLPASIVSDQDPRIGAQFWQALCRALKIDSIKSTAHHHQTPGLVERTIRTIKTMLRKSANYSQNNWVEQLPFVEFALNNTTSATTKISPFNFTLSFNPRAVPADPVPTHLPHADAVAQAAADNLAQARVAAEAAQKRQSHYANQHRSESPTYKVGDMVLLDATNINLPQDAQRPKKLLATRVGPFKVTAVDRVLPNVTLDISKALPGVHPVFHVDKIQRYHNPKELFPERPSDAFPISYEEQDGVVYNAIEKVVDVRTRYRKREYLLKFVGQSPENNKWIRSEDFRAPKLISDFYSRQKRQRRSSRKKKRSLDQAEEDILNFSSDDLS